MHRFVRFHLPRPNLRLVGLVGQVGRVGLVGLVELAPALGAAVCMGLAGQIPLRRQPMTLVRSSLFGVGIGATSMLLLDPLGGARRRALIRDKLVSATRKTGEAAGATWRDLGNWTTGIRSKT